MIAVVLVAIDDTVHLLTVPPPSGAGPPQQAIRARAARDAPSTTLAPAGFSLTLS
jgi:hypothetical protein